MTEPEATASPKGPAEVASHTARRIGMGIVALLLGLVIIAPIALSSGDLVKWAMDPQGLGLSSAWAWLVFISLDAAAATCVAMVILAAWRGETGGAFTYLTWVFAGASALANYRHGTTTAARDDELFFPGMSILGPLLLEVVLRRLRRWIKEDTHEQLTSRAKFGRRWLPGVAFRETLSAWAVAQREGISEPATAIALVRERNALVELDPGERVAFAWDACPGQSTYEVRAWLLARGIRVDRAALAAGRPAPIDVEVMDLPAAPERAELPERAPEPLVIERPGAPAVVEPAPALVVEPESEQRVIDLRESPELEPAAAPVAPVVPVVAVSASAQVASGEVAPVSAPAPEPVRERSSRSQGPSTGGLPVIPVDERGPAPSVEGLSKRAALRAALTWSGGDVPATLAHLASVGINADKSDAYKVRSILAEESAKEARSNVISMGGGRQS